MNINLIYELRNKSGSSLKDCKEALDIFDDNVEQAYQYLLIRSQALCRRRLDGMAWQKQDYINWVKENIKLH